MGLLTCIDLTKCIKIWMWHILMHSLGRLDCKSHFFPSKSLVWKNEVNMSHKWSKWVSFEKRVSTIRKDPHHCYLPTCLQVNPDALSTSPLWLITLDSSLLAHLVPSPSSDPRLSLLPFFLSSSVSSSSPFDWSIQSAHLWLLLLLSHEQKQS